MASTSPCIGCAEPLTPISCRCAGSRTRMASRSTASAHASAWRSPPPHCGEQELDELRKWLDVAQKLGATHVRVFGGDKPDGASLDQAIGFAVETLKRGAE